MVKTKIKIMICILALTLYGCGFNFGLSGADIDSITKSNSQIQEFLSLYPNSDITAVYISQEKAQDSLTSIRSQCGEEMEAKDYYKVTVKDTTSDFTITLWIDVKNMNTACITKRGENLQTNGQTQSPKDPTRQSLGQTPQSSRRDSVMTNYKGQSQTNQSNHSIKCYSNIDCASSEGSPYCQKASICTQVTTSSCRNPGQPNSKCIYNTITNCNNCAKGCSNGECVVQLNDTITSPVNTTVNNTNNNTTAFDPCSIYECPDIESSFFCMDSNKCQTMTTRSCDGSTGSPVCLNLSTTESCTDYCVYGCNGGVCSIETPSNDSNQSPESNQSTDSNKSINQSSDQNQSIGDSNEDDQIFGCSDSDGGRDYSTKGDTIDATSGGSDICNGANLVEHYCDNDIRKTETYKCPNGCLNGFCKEDQEVDCTDSDGGKDYYTKGNTQDFNSGGSDICNGANLVEHYCTQFGHEYETYKCANGCADGACHS